MARHRQRFVRPPARTKIWVDNAFTVETLSTNAKNLIAVAGSGLLALRPYTILRTRIDLNFRTDQAAASEAPTGAYGQIVVKEVAAVIGVTAVPGPIVDTDADWYVYQGMTAPFVFGDGTSSSWSNAAGVRYSIDSKAMRKVGTTDSDIFVFEMRSVGGGQLNCEGRQLLQLH